MIALYEKLLEIIEIIIENYINNQFMIRKDLL